MTVLIWSNCIEFFGLWIFAVNIYFNLTLCNRLGHLERSSLVWVKLWHFFTTLDSILVWSCHIEPIFLIKNIISLFEVSFDNATWNAIFRSHWLLKVVFHEHIQALTVLNTIFEHRLDFSHTARACLIWCIVLRIDIWCRKWVSFWCFIQIISPKLGLNS